MMTAQFAAVVLDTTATQLEFIRQNAVGRPTLRQQGQPHLVLVAHGLAPHTPLLRIATVLQRMAVAAADMKVAASTGRSLTEAGS
jgi:hypothetical protein